jgi:hypothetical protein
MTTKFGNTAGFNRCVSRLELATLQVPMAEYYCRSWQNCWLQWLNITSGAGNTAGSNGRILLQELATLLSSMQGFGNTAGFS